MYNTIFEDVNSRGDLYNLEFYKGGFFWFILRYPGAFIALMLGRDVAP